MTFYRLPRDHWRHLRTSNVVESPFAALRLRTDTAKRFKKVANATAVVWRLLVAERKFRRINSPEQPPAVAAGQHVATVYRSNEANTGRPPPDVCTHVLTKPQ